MFATQSHEAYPYYQHEHIGYNYLMSNNCVGIGRSQMTIVNDYIAHHKPFQHLYKDAFSCVEGISVHPNPSPAYDGNYWICIMLLNENLHVQG